MKSFFCLLFIFSFFFTKAAEPVSQIGGECYDFLFSNDGRSIIGVFDNSILYYDSNNGSLVKYLPNMAPQHSSIYLNEKNDLIFTEIYDPHSTNCCTVIVRDSSGNQLASFAINGIDGVNRSGDKVFRYNDDSFFMYDFKKNDTDRLQINKHCQFYFISRFGEYFGIAEHNSVSRDDSVFIYNTSTKELISTLSVKDAVSSSFSFSDDGSLISYGTEDGLIHIYNTATNKEIVTLKSKDSRFQYITKSRLSPDNRFLAYYALFYNPYIFFEVIDLNTGEVILDRTETDEFYFFSYGNRIEFSPDSKHVMIMNYYENKICNYEITDSKRKLVINDCWGRTYNYSADENQIILNSRNVTGVFNAKTKAPEDKTIGFFKDPYDITENLSCVNFDHRYYIKSPYYHNVHETLEKIDLKTGKIIDVSHHFIGNIKRITPSPVENTLLIEFVHKVAMLINIENWKTLYTIDLKYPGKIEFSKDGSRIIHSEIIHYDYQIFTSYDARTGERIGYVELDYGLSNITFNENGKIVMGTLLSPNKEIVHIDLETGATIRTTPINYCCSPRLTPDGKRIIYLDGSKKQFLIVDAVTSKIINTIDFPPIWYSVSTDYKDKVIVTDAPYGTEYVISIDSGQVESFNSHTINSDTLISEQDGYRDLLLWGLSGKTIEKSIYTKIERVFTDIKSLNSDKRACISTDEQVYILDLEKNKFVDSLNFKSDLKTRQHNIEFCPVNNSIYFIKFHANENSKDSLLIWNLTNGSKSSFYLENNQISTKDYQGITVNETGRIVYLYGRNVIQGWNLDLDRTINAVILDKDSITSVQYDSLQHNLYVSCGKSIRKYTQYGMYLTDSMSFDFDITTFQLSPDNKNIAILFESFILGIYDKATMKRKILYPIDERFDGHLCRYPYIRFTPDGNKILLAINKYLGVYDLPESRISGYIYRDASNDCIALNDSLVVYPGYSGMIYILNLNNRQLFRTLNSPTEGYCNISSYSHLPYIATIEEGKSSMNFYYYTGQFTSSIRLSLIKYNEHRKVKNIVFNPSSESVFVNYINKDGKPVMSMEYNANNGHILRYFMYVNFTGLSQDGRIAVGFKDSVITLWDMDRTEEILTIPIDTWQLEPGQIEISPKGKMIAYGKKDGNLTIYNASNGEQLQNIKVSDNAVTNVKFVPTSSVVTTIGKNNPDTNVIKFWHPLNGELLDSIYDNKIIMFNKSGSLCLASNGGYGIYEYKLDFSKYGNIEDQISSVTYNHADKPGLTVIPNPFTTTASICYKLTCSGNISLSLYNQLGEQVKSVDNGYKEPGEYKAVIDGESLPSGQYYYVLKTAEEVISGKVILIK